MNRLEQVIELLLQFEEDLTFGKHSHTPYAVAISRVIHLADLNQGEVPLEGLQYQVGDLVYSFSGTPGLLAVMILKACKVRMPPRQHRLLAALLTGKVQMRVAYRRAS